MINVYISGKTDSSRPKTRRSSKCISAGLENCDRQVKQNITRRADTLVTVTSIPSLSECSIHPHRLNTPFYHKCCREQKRNLTINLEATVIQLRGTSTTCMFRFKEREKVIITRSFYPINSTFDSLDQRLNNIWYTRTQLPVPSTSHYSYDWRVEKRICLVDDT